MTIVAEFGGARYEFPDGTTDEEIDRTIQALSKPSSFVDVVSAAPAVAASGLGKTLAGASTLLGDVTGWEGAKTFGKDVREASNALATEATPPNPSLFDEMLLSGTASVAQMVPYALGGVGAGLARVAGGAGARAAAGTAANVTIGGASLGEGLAEYGEQRAAGMSGPRAFTHATIQGLAEYIPERLAFAPITDLLTMGKTATAKVVGQFLGRDIVGEQVTTLIEDINSKLSRRPDMTFGEYLHDAAVTFGSTAISGPIQAGMGAGLAKLSAPVAAALTPPVVQPPPPMPGTELPPIGQEGAAATSPSVVKGPGVQGLVLGPDGQWTPENIANSPPAELPFEQRLALYTQIMGREDRFSEDAVTKVHNDLLIRDLHNSLIAEAGTDPAKLYDLRMAGLKAGEPLTPDLMSDMLAAKQRRAFEGGFLPPPTAEVDLGTQVDMDTTAHTLQVRTADDLSVWFHHNQMALVTESVVGDSVNGYHGLLSADLATLAPGELLVAYNTQTLSNPPAAYKNRVGEVAPVVESWLKAVLPKYNMVLQVTESKDFYGSATMAGQNTLVMRISTEALNDPTQWYTTAAHEMGHMLHFVEYSQASPEVQKALYDEYAASLVTAAKSTFRQGAEIMQSPQTASRWVDTMRDKGYDPEKDNFAQTVTSYGASRWARGGEATYKLYSFNEWMAEQSNRYFQTRAGVTPQTESFFKKVIRRLATFFTNNYKQIAPTASFVKFMSDIIAKNPSAQLVSSTDVARMKAELLAEGVHPAVVESLKDPNGSYDFALGQKLVENIRTTPSKDPKAVRMYEHKTGYALDTALDFLQTKISRRKPKSVFAELRSLGLNPNVIAELEQDIEFRDKPRVDGARLFHKLVDMALPLRVYEGKNGVVQLFTKLGNNVVFTGSVVYSNNNGTPVAWVSTAGPVAVDPSIYTPIVYKLMRLAGLNGAEKIYFDGSSALATHARDRFGGEQISSAAYMNDVGLDTPNERFLDSGTLLDVNPSVYDDPIPEGMSYSLATGMDMLRTRLNLKGEAAGAFPTSIGKFNNLFKWILGPFQIAKMNISVPGVSAYLDGLRNRMGYRARWHAGANDVLDTWAFRMPKDQAAKVSRLLFDEDRSGVWRSTKHANDAKPGEYIYTLTDKAKSDYGLSVEAEEVYSNVRNMLALALDEFQKVGYIDTARSEFGADSPITHTLREAVERRLSVQEVRTTFEAMMQNGDLTLQDRVKKALDALDSAFAEQRAKPYMMHPRFGQWAVIARDAEGKTLYYETFESRREQKAAYGEIKAKFPDGTVSAEYIEDIPYALQGMPPQLLDALARTLDLTPDQLDRYKDQLRAMSPANSFVHNLRRRKNIEGYTEDAVRGFADYFRRMGNYISRIKAGPELDAALATLKGYADNVSKTDNTDVTNLRRLHEALQDHVRYLSSPRNELGEIKSFVAMFHFAGNVSSAVVNTLQVPMVTLPYLSSRFGIAKTTKELTQAYKDVVGRWFDPKGLAADEQAMIQHALDSGFLNESFQTTMAQLAEGSALMRTQPMTKARQAQNTFNHYAMWMFQKAEELNRRVTTLATYRLNRAEKFVGEFDKEAFALARSAVEDTQNEYAKENRPAFMRGNASIVFQFMHYTQNMLFQMLGGDQSWKRLLLAQLVMGGLLGMPFAEDVENVAQYLARKWFGKDFDLERNARDYLKDMGINADLIVRGATSNLAGFDVSKRVSLGQIIPGVPAMTSSQQFNDALSEAVGDVGGAGFSLILNALKAYGSTQPDQVKRWSGVMPSAVRNALRAEDAMETGQVTSGSGAKLADVDALDAIGMALGFQPGQVVSAQRVAFAQKEIGTYWTARRQALLDEYAYVMLDRGGDREGMSDVMDRIQTFNDVAPDPKLTIALKTLRAGLKSRMSARQLREAGFGTNPSTRLLSQDVSASFASE